MIIVPFVVESARNFADFFSKETQLDVIGKQVAHT